MRRPGRPDPRTPAMARRQPDHRPTRTAESPSADLVNDQGLPELAQVGLSRGYGTLLRDQWEGQLRSRLLTAISARCKRTLGAVE